MALRDQPYLPLYIQDIMTDEKLNECSASTHGIYIKGLMCLMHKSEDYGKILLKQKYKQTENSAYNFALQLVKHLPYSVNEIENAISELIRERVCYYEGDYLCQKRMIRDNEISEVRSEAGKKGGKNTQLVKAKSKANAKAKIKANPEYEYISENENDNILESVFEIFRQNYPGTKKGHDIEFQNFVKKNKDWRSIVPVLSDSLTYQVNCRELKKQSGGFIPEWKNLSTWINQKCWEEEIATNNLSNGKTKNTGATDEELSLIFARKYGSDSGQRRDD